MTKIFRLAESVDIERSGSYGQIRESANLGSSDDTHR
jgi:hypothetical protein